MKGGYLDSCTQTYPRSGVVKVKEATGGNTQVSDSDGSVLMLLGELYMGMARCQLRIEGNRRDRSKSNANILETKTGLGRLKKLCT